MQASEVSLPLIRNRAPGPRGYPILGVLPQLRKNPLHTLLVARRDYGDVVYLGKTLSQSFYLISHPDYVQHILQNDLKVYSRGQNLKIFQRLGNDCMALAEGDAWLPRRRLIQPAFHQKQVALLATMISDVIHEKMEQWHSVAQGGQPINIAHEMAQLTLEIIVKTMFSSDITDHLKEASEAVSIILSFLSKRILGGLHLPLDMPTPENRRFLKAQQWLDAMMYQIIESRKKSNIERNDLLSMLLHSRLDGQGLTSKQLHDEVISFFITGHETTSIGLMWTWYLLSKHPSIRARFEQELETVLADRSPTYEDLQHLTYTNMVFHESLRLCPPGWIMSRTPYTDVEIGGYPISAKSVLFFSPYVIHRHPDFWDNPEGFDPERFTPEQIAKRHKYAYFPFGGGARLCIGKSFALMEAQLILATIAQKFRLDLRPECAQVVPQGGFALRESQPIMMSLRPRV